MDEYRFHTSKRPPRLGDGETVFYVDSSIATDDEIALTLGFLCKRKLFGHCFQKLFPEYFTKTRRDGGVLIAHFIPSNKILPELTFPGDIDLLIIPYEGNELILSSVLTVEIKIVRAAFHKQGKSPNEYGFSQAESMLAHGFPYVAVGHLIISDESPEESWRTVLEARVGDGDTLTNLRTIRTDMMSSDLIERSYGRLRKNCKNQTLGFFAAHVNKPGIWTPEGKSCLFNDNVSHRTLHAIRDYYESNYEHFFDTPAFE